MLGSLSSVLYGRDGHVRGRRKQLWLRPHQGLGQETAGGVPRSVLGIKGEEKGDLIHLLRSFYFLPPSICQMLVWDDALMGPMDLVASAQFLKERQVVKMVRLSAAPGSLDARTGVSSNVVFVSRPQVELMDRIANFVKRFESAASPSSPGDRVEFHLLLIPRKSLLCEHRLKDKGVFGSFTFVDELNIHWFPLETDVISMENRFVSSHLRINVCKSCNPFNSQVFRNFHLDGDPTSLHPVALAMLSLQALTGIIPAVYGKGRAAKQLWEYMSRMRRELSGTGRLPKVAPLIDSLVIIDRQVIWGPKPVKSHVVKLNLFRVQIDLISPLVMQLTYEGLIDEMFGIRNASVTLPASRFNTGDQEQEEQEVEEAEAAAAAHTSSNLKSIQLSSSEDMFADIRDKNFNAVCEVGSH